MVLEIARRFINGEWKTTALDEDGGGGAQTFLAATVTLTDAQIKALPSAGSAGYNIVPAPGAGNVIIPLQGIMHLKNWHADYTNIDPICALQLDVSGFLLPGLVMEESYGFVTQLLAGGGPDGTWTLAGPAWRGLPNQVDDQPVADGGWYDSDIANKPLKFWCQGANNGAGDFGGGDPAQALDVTVVYQILTTT